MILMRIQGGFASQLIKYVLGYAVSTICNTDYAIDIHDYVEGYFRPFVLNLLNINDIKCILSKDSIDEYIEIKNGLELCSIIENYHGEKLYLSSEQNCYKEFYEKYSAQYVEIENKLLKELELLNVSDYYKETSKIIENNYTVSVHVRRGDFVTLNWNDDTKNYKAAIGYILKFNPQAIFVFFSNDIEWTKHEFGGNKNFVFIEKRSGYESDIEDFFLLTKCNTKILSSKSGYSQYAWMIGKIKYGLDDGVFIGADEEDTANILLKNQLKRFRHLNDDDRKEGLNKYKELRVEEIETVSKTCRITRKEAVDMSFERERKIDFWKNYYKAKLKSKHKFIMISNTGYRVWNLDKAVLAATILARLGADVVYAYKSREVDEKTNKKSMIKNMDGEYLGLSKITYSNIFDFFKVIIKYKYFNRYTVIYNFENKKIYRFIKNNKIFIDDIYNEINLREIDNIDYVFNFSEESALNMIREYVSVEQKNINI